MGTPSLWLHLSMQNDDVRRMINRQIDGLECADENQSKLLVACSVLYMASSIYRAVVGQLTELRPTKTSLCSSSPCLLQSQTVWLGLDCLDRVQ
jgi:hypothetical protein